MALGNLKWDQEGLFDEKTQLQKSHATVPLRIFCRPSKKHFIKGPVNKLHLKTSALNKH